MVIFHLQFSGVQLASRETKTNPDTLFGNFFNEPVMTINRISIEPVGSTARDLYMYFVLAARKVPRSVRNPTAQWRSPVSVFSTGCPKKNWDLCSGVILDP